MKHHALFVSRITRVLAFVAMIGAGSAVQAADPVPVADFFRRPSVTDPVVSPSGKFVAATMAGGPQRRQRLVILNLQDLEQSKVIAAFDDADIDSVAWVNDQRLVFGTSSRTLAYAYQTNYQGLFSVARDNTQVPRRLIKGRWTDGLGKLSSGVKDRELSPYHSLHNTLRDGSDDVIVSRLNFDAEGSVSSVTLLRLNTATGAVQAVPTGTIPGHVKQWAVDDLGIPRGMVSSDDGKSRVYLRPAAEAAWTQVREYDTFDAKGSALTPVLASRDGAVYAQGYLDKSRDTSSLLRLVLGKDGLKVDGLLSLEGYDFRGRLVTGSKGQLLGVRYLSDAWSVHWFDATMKKIQADVDAQLRGTMNSIACGECDAPESVLVTAWSDRQPNALLLHDVQENKLSPLMGTRPWIDAKTMAQREMQRFVARDGLNIPVHVTRPPGIKGPAPMVVLVHGGPWVRGSPWRWDADSQFLASRGYVVVEPEFRGSVGFGDALYRAGFKQWGLAMQDDVADAARWAVKQGFADPKRICIAGASYGGYATLMGLVKDPDLYRCGVAWAAVTDIDLMYSIHWSDFSNTYKTYGMPVLVGDRRADAKQLVDTSPLQQAARIKQPLLIAHGGKDVRVPIEHGVAFRDAVQKNNPDVEWVFYPTEGHGWTLEANDIDFWTRVERFLDKNLRNAR